MLKSENSLKIIDEAKHKVLELLSRIPDVRVKHVETAKRGVENYDLLFAIRIESIRISYELACIVKTSASAHSFKEATLLFAGSRGHKTRATMYIVPYIQPSMRDFIESFNGNYLDFVGNVRLAIGPIFIQICANQVPKPVVRELKSPFRPKAALVCKAMLEDVSRVWKIAEISKHTNVSFGQISNVLTLLEERGIVEKSTIGARLVDPDKLIQQWAAVYPGVKGERYSFHTVLHGNGLLEALKKSLIYGWKDGQNAVLASFSAASWMAPYARTAKTHIYADPIGLDRLINALNLRQVATGANVEVVVPTDSGVFFDAYQAAPDISCTSRVQTYLDLKRAGERGEEAAEFLKEKVGLW
jgi:hypothetical protein